MMDSLDFAELPMQLTRKLSGYFVPVSIALALGYEFKKSERFRWRPA